MHSANIDNSERLQSVTTLIFSRGEQGITTREIDRTADCVAVSAIVDEIRDNGFLISCRHDGKTEKGRQVYRYWYAGYDQDADIHAKKRTDKSYFPRGPHPTVHLASDPPTPLADSDGSSPTELGYAEILNPPPDVPSHLIGEVIRFERMPEEERRRYQRVCEGHAADGTCLLCAWIIAGDHDDVLPSYARKAHVLVCADPSLPSNVELCLSG